MIGILNTPDLARKNGGCPLSYRKWAKANTSTYEMWFGQTMNPPLDGKFSAPLQSRRVTTIIIGRTNAAMPR